MTESTSNPLDPRDERPDADVRAGAAAPKPGTDSPVVDWFGQSAAQDAELADKLVDAVGEDEAERQFDRQAVGEQTQRTRHGDHIDPHQGEAAYRPGATTQTSTGTSGSGPSATDVRSAAAGAVAKVKEKVSAVTGAATRTAGNGDGSEVDGSKSPASAGTVEGPSDAEKLFHTYLRDHQAADMAGLALARRVLHNNEGTEFEADLRQLAEEIEADSTTLRHAMADLRVDPSPIKMLAARASELAARLKTNGRLIHYSPSSRVLELEGLAAGLAAKQQFWTSLQMAPQTAIGATELERLAQRAERQLDKVSELHRRAASVAFAA